MSAPSNLKPLLNHCNVESWLRGWPLGQNEKCVLMWELSLPNSLLCASFYCCKRQPGAAGRGQSGTTVKKKKNKLSLSKTSKDELLFTVKQSLRQQSLLQRIPFWTILGSCILQTYIENGLDVVSLWPHKRASRRLLKRHCCSQSFALSKENNKHQSSHWRDSRQAWAAWQDFHPPLDLSANLCKLATKCG